MKKIMIFLLAAVLLVSLCACGTNEDNAPNGGDQGSTEGVVGKGYVFLYQDAELTPGAQFRPDMLPEPEFEYTAPNCALAGNDVVYNYGDIEVAVYSDGASNTIQSVYIINPNLTTPEGLALGDSVTKVTELYGDSYTENGAQWQFAKGNMILCILTQDGFVTGIEYLLAG